MVRNDLEWFGLLMVWNGLELFGMFFGMIWNGLQWFGIVMVWNGFEWFGMDWNGL